MIDSIGELNRRIDILKIVNALNNRGYPVPTEEHVVSCMAAVKDGTYRANEHFTAALGRVTEVVSFTIRYKTAKVHGVREGMFIRYDGDLYRIIARPYDANHARRFVSLNTEAVGEVSG